MRNCATSIVHLLWFQQISRIKTIKILAAPVLEVIVLPHQSWRVLVSDPQYPQNFKKSSENNFIFLELTCVVTSPVLLTIIYVQNVTRLRPRVNGVEWCGWREAWGVWGGEPKACLSALNSCVVWCYYLLCWLCVKNHWNYNVLKT
jgi:hypothetical protein